MKKGVDYTGVCIIFICHDGNGSYLMAKRSTKCRDEHGRWDWGGGGLDFDQTIEEMLKKEIKEEYCTDVLAFEFLGYRDVHREENGVKSHWIALDFKVLVDREKVKNGEPHKFDEIGWFPITALPQPLHSQIPPALEQHKGKL